MTWVKPLAGRVVGVHQPQAHRDDILRREGDEVRGVDLEALEIVRVERLVIPDRVRDGLCLPGPPADTPGRGSQ